MMTDYEWYLKNDLSTCEGKWVAIMAEKVVASSEDLNELLKEFKDRYSFEKVAIAKIPDRRAALV